MKNSTPPPARFLSFKTLTGKFGYLRSLVVFLIFLIPLLNSESANAVNVVIEGASSFVCPKTTYTYTAKTYNSTFGYEIFSCGIAWQVYKGNDIVGGGSGYTLTFTFPDVGAYEIKAVASSCSTPNFGSGEKTITTTSRVPIPSPVLGPAMCSSGQSYTYTTSPSLASIFPGPPDGICFYHYPYLWTAPAGWSIDGGENTKFTNETVTIVAPAGTPSGSYIISVQGSISKPGSGGFWYSTKRDFSIQIGPFNSGQVMLSGAAMVCNGNSYTYTANIPTGHQSGYTYSWIYPSGWIIENVFANTIKLYIPLSNNSYGPLRVSVNNGCGTSPLTGITTFPCSYMMSLGDFKIYPNPSFGELFVEYDVEENQLREPFDEELKTQEFKPLNYIFKVDIFDRTEKLVGTGESADNKVHLDTKGLKPGTYYLHIYSGKQVLRKQILIEN